MKNLVTVLFVLVSLVSIGQDRPERGPYNILQGGVIDGVVIKDEVPVREAIPYEHVRLADYVWSKRVFSRIDCRQKMNHDLFFPYDFFEDDGEKSTYSPSTSADIDHPSWNKDQKRWSLWTVIMRHIFLGELTVYKCASDFNEFVEDGYSLKYPIQKNTRDDYFVNGSYKSKVNKLITAGGKGQNFKIPNDDGSDTLVVFKSNRTFKEFYDSILGVPDYAGSIKVMVYEDMNRWWDNSEEGAPVSMDRITRFVSSQSIVAYNIKEDWFFDKERSVLDRRIISIAPVARYTASEYDSLSGEKSRGKLLIYNKVGAAQIYGSGGWEDYKGAIEENELFWLYFPELRNVMVNYYVYNDKSDSQWMSFDDVFWKRKFTGQIYKVSDKFDRELEDFKYGVDALYEAEKIKDDMRKWEHDVWNY